MATVAKRVLPYIRRVTTSTVGYCTCAASYRPASGSDWSPGWVRCACLRVCGRCAELVGNSSSTRGSAAAISTHVKSHYAAYWRHPGTAARRPGCMTHAHDVVHCVTSSSSSSSSPPAAVAASLSLPLLQSFVLRISDKKRTHVHYQTCYCWRPLSHSQGVQWVQVHPQDG